MADVLANFPPELQQHRILSAVQSAAFCGFALPTWRKMYRRGDAPPPIKLSARRYGWKAGVLVQWIAEKEKAAAA